MTIYATCGSERWPILLIERDKRDVSKARIGIAHSKYGRWRIAVRDGTEWVAIDPEYRTRAEVEFAVSQYKGGIKC